MIIDMVVVYEGQEMEYSMTVADGRMTIKWLGKSIEEELAVDEKVFVELTSTMPLSSLGRPLRERWMFIAFNIGDQNSQGRSIAIQEEYKAMEEARERQRVAAEARAADLTAKKGAQMRRVIASQLYCSEKVERAFERDWAELSNLIQQPIDNITEDLEEQELVKGTVLANYVTVVEVFKYYASVGSARSTGELDFMEYSAFMHDLRDFSAAKSRDLVEKTYGEAISACRNGKGRTTSGTMGMVEFIFAAIRLACTRHLVSPADFSGGAWSVGECGSGSAKIKDARSVHEAVELFMQSGMVPLAHRKVVGLEIKTALDSDEILAVYHDHNAELKAVFDRYSKMDGQATENAAAAAAGNLLNISEFGKVLCDARLMGGKSKEDDELTVKEARQAFAGAQNDLCGGDDDDNNSSSSSSSSLKPIIVHPSEAGPPIEQMNYPEFLEGIARVAVLKWEDASLSFKDKIGRAIAAVRSLSGTAHRGREWVS